LCQPLYKRRVDIRESVVAAGEDDEVFFNAWGVCKGNVKIYVMFSTMRKARQAATVLFCDSLASFNMFQGCWSIVDVRK
jgi:hypothetical protein